jgi:hypothetical protein
MIAIPSIDSTTGYIDRIEYNEACVYNGQLEEKGGMESLVVSALWTCKQLFPSLTHLTLQDDSHIYCKKGSKLYKLNLAFDYILKYGETWYEKKFGAILPEYYRIPYKESLKVLDDPLAAYEYIVLREPRLAEYKDIYMSSSSPRNFLQALRYSLGSTYCFKVGTWLSSYMTMIGVRVMNEFWTLPLTDRKEPLGYRMEETAAVQYGGSRKSSTRKHSNFRMVSGERSHSIVGYYL